jgi:hypothetical protein
VNIELGPNEEVRLTRLAALSEGRTAKGGRLIVTTNRVIFRPGLRSRITGVAPVSIPRSAIASVQVEPERSGLFNGGFRHRLVVQLDDQTRYHFAVNRPQAFTSAFNAELHA